MEMMTDLHARTPRTHSQWLVRPGRTPQGRAVGRGRMPKPGRPIPRGEPPPPSGRPRAASTTQKASSQERTLLGW